MKRTSVLIAVLAQLVGGAALAVTVDFSVLGPPTNDPPLTVDITTPNSLTLNGVTFTYDNAGTPDPALDSASADSLGIFGSTFGSLGLVFDGRGATALFLEFTVDGAPGPDPDALVALFGNGDSVIVPGVFTPNDPNDPTSLGTIFGTLEYPTASPFDAVSLLFSPVVDPESSDYAPYFFSVSNVVYEQPVPEPATLVLLASGLAGLCGRRLFRKKD